MIKKDFAFKIWDNEIGAWYKPTYEAYKGNLEYLVLETSGNLLMIKNGRMISESLFAGRFTIYKYESPVIVHPKCICV